MESYMKVLPRNSWIQQFLLLRLATFGTSEDTYGGTKRRIPWELHGLDRRMSLGHACTSPSRDWHSALSVALAISEATRQVRVDNGADNNCKS